MSTRRRIAPLLGIIVRLEDGCLACGSKLAKVTAGRGMHLTDLQCTGCRANRGHLSRPQLGFIADAVANGRPTEPVAISRDERFAFAKQIR